MMTFNTSGPGLGALSVRDVALAAAAKDTPGIYGKYAWAWGLLSVASGAISGYHGYKRNNSTGWAIGWFVLGSFFPIITPVIAVAQGYAKPK